jgi:hypothetical protein
LRIKKEKMGNRRYFALFVLFLSSLTVYGQDFHFGIRAGLNYATFRGPAETDVVEQFDLNNGFHFGVVGMLRFNDYFALGTEILYNQMGTKYRYEGPSYYRFNVGDVDFLYENIKLNLDVSNSYINLPVLIHFNPIKKLELVAGGYMGFLVNPVAGGRLEFGSKFYQNLEYNYYNDTAGSVPFGSQTINVKVPQPDGTDEITVIYKTVGAYYQYTSEQVNDDTGKYYNWFDLGLTGGITYFINRSLYAGVRAEYGLLDVTDNDLDRSLKSVDDEGNFILRNDKDTNLSFAVSLGFRF